MKIGDEIYVKGIIDEIRQDVVIIRNAGGFFGTAPNEIVPRNTEPVIGECETCRFAIMSAIEQPCRVCNHNGGWFNNYKERITDCQW